MRRITTNRLRLAWRKLRVACVVSAVILIAIQLARQWPFVESGSSGTYAFGVGNSRIGVGWDKEAKKWQLYDVFFEFPRHADGSPVDAVDTYFIDVSKHMTHRESEWGTQKTLVLYSLRAWMPKSYTSGWPEYIPELPDEEGLARLVAPWMEQHWAAGGPNFVADLAGNSLHADDALRWGWTDADRSFNRQRAAAFAMRTVLLPLTSTACVFWALALCLAWRTGPGECRRCRYDLSGLPEQLSCPECGLARRRRDHSSARSSMTRSRCAS